MYDLLSITTAATKIQRNQNKNSILIGSYHKKKYIMIFKRRQRNIWNKKITTKI